MITDDELAVLIIRACSSRNLFVKHHFSSGSRSVWPKKQHQQKTFLHVFLMLDFYFKTVDTSIRSRLRVKHAVLIQYLRSDEMLTGLISVSLLMLYRVRSALFFSTRECGAVLYITSLKHRNYGMDQNL